MTDALDRHDKMARLNHREQLDPYYSRHDDDDFHIRDSNPIATAIAFAALICAILLCVWASTPGSCELRPAAKQVNDAPQQRMEAIAWARHYEQRKR